MAAAGSGADKENAAPSTSAAAAGPRRHGYGVKSCGVKKRPSRAARWAGRVPLRDITNLVAAAAGPEAPLALGQDAAPPAAAELAKNPEEAVPAVAGAPGAQDGAAAGGAAGKKAAAGGAAAKKAAAAPRYSLRKGFR
ncbi:testis-specific gene A8 protein-like [Panicum virgatum]|uniref:Uncharacterized protein n=1 Tax=Panicum virgatum TaxID=38727 RepID=A0A8T0T632_PANVG|nr:testis-specific gene A8 protein-like [Panicum virgatum]KAG2606490.1 hypothetical protein PVAP13_4NG169600 [Panicum virgatum]